MVSLYSGVFIPNIRTLVSFPSTPELAALVASHGSLPGAFDPSSPLAFLNRVIALISSPLLLVRGDSKANVTAEKVADKLAREPVTEAERAQMLSVVAAGNTIAMVRTALTGLYSCVSDASMSRRPLCRHCS